MEAVAKAAWASYSDAVGGKAFDGKPLPTWEELGNLQKQGWVAAAVAVLLTVP